MGTFLGYYGEMNVPEEQRAELAERMVKLLHIGGMLQVDTVEMFGKKIYLLHPLEPREDDGVYVFYYNYFENDSWESAAFHPNEGIITSNKVGYSTFHTVTYLAYLLLEFYDANRGICNCDGEITKVKGAISWLNYLFGEHYTNERRMSDIWHIIDLIHQNSVESYCDWLPDNSSLFPRWIDDYDVDEMYLAQLAVCYDYALSFNEAWLTRAEEWKAAGEPKDELSSEASLGFWGLEIRDIIKAIAEELSMDEQSKIARMKAILCDYDTSVAEAHSNGKTPLDNLFMRFTITSAVANSIVTARIMANQFGLDYWELMSDVMSGSRAEKAKEVRLKQIELKPVTPIPTAEFLGKEDDDRAYWWNEGGDVVLSRKMNKWLAGLRAEIDDISAGERPFNDGISLLKTLINAFSELKQAKIYAFRDMYYGFLMCWSNPRIQAAVVLLQKLMERYDLEKKKDYIWIRRYVAVLGNRELCKKALAVDYTGNL